MTPEALIAELDPISTTFVYRRLDFKQVSRIHGCRVEESRACSMQA